MAKAAETGGWGTIVFPSTKITSIGGLIQSIIEWVLTFAGALAVIAIVYSGIMYITAAGDAEKAATARKNLTWAIMGIVFVILALVIVNTIATVVK